MTLRLAASICLLACACGEVASPADAGDPDTASTDGAAADDATPDAPAPVTLTVTRTGDRTGRVASTPDGIDCGPTCAHEFPAGTEVKLIATADPGSAFSGWDAADCPTLDPCTVIAGAVTVVEAKFVLVP